MKPEIIIKNWLLSWFKPKKVTAYNTQAMADRRDDLTEDNFGAFISMFVDERREQEFTDDEKGALEQLILRPLIFASGYPSNAKTALQLGAVYIIGAGWLQTTSWPGANKWEGRMSTQIAVTGSTTGENLNMGEVSLLLHVITTLLIAGHNLFISEHMENPTIQETPFATDEQNSYMKKFAIRTVTLNYDYERHGLITPRNLTP